MVQHSNTKKVFQEAPSSKSVSSLIEEAARHRKQIFGMWESFVMAPISSVLRGKFRLHIE